MSEENHHGNYVTLWLILMGLLFAGMGAQFMGNKMIATCFLFGIAFVKAYIVATRYMHLKFEPFFVRLIFLCGFVAIGTLIVGLIPDIVYVFGG